MMEPSRRQSYFFLVLIVAVAVLTFLMFRPFLATLALAAVFAVWCRPAYLWLRRRFGLGPNFAALLLGLAVVILAAALLSLVLARGFIEATDLYSSISQQPAAWRSALERAEVFIGRWLPALRLDLQSYFSQFAGWLVDNFAALFSLTFAAFLKTLLWLFAFFFFLRDGHRLRQVIMELSPLDDRDEEHIINRLKMTIRAVVGGFLLVALIQGTLVGIGFAIFGVPKAAIWGSLAVLAALVPGIGTALVTLPGVVYLWLAGSGGAAIGLLIWAVLLVGLVDNFLAPLLYSRGLPAGSNRSLYLFLMLLAVLGGLALFGPAGFILGPVSLSLFLVLIEIYRRRFHVPV